MDHPAAMRAVLHLLTAMCLIWCALGVGEPVAAHGHAGAAEVATGNSHATNAAGHDGGPAGDDAAVDPAHHHHCPMAPEQAGCMSVAPRLTMAVPLAVPCVASLSSRTRRPPLQPPAA